MTVFSVLLSAALIPFSLGLLYRLFRWIRGGAWPAGEGQSGGPLRDGTPGGKSPAEIPGLPAEETRPAGERQRQDSSRKGWRRWGRVLVRDVLLQYPVLRVSRRRWIMHMAIFGGFLGLFFLHALDDILLAPLVSGYEPTANPYRFLRNGFGALLLFGIGIAVWRRWTLPRLRERTRRRDWAPLILLAAIAVSGFGLEAVQKVSVRIYDDMVYDYVMVADETERAVLRTFWASNYAVAFPGDRNLPPPRPETMALGRSVHQDHCAYCHAPPGSAFVSHGLARMISPVGTILDALRAPELLQWTHILLCFAGLAWLPFGKFLHLVSTPAQLFSRSRDGDAAAGEMAMDACTRCGTCSRFCSVEPVHRILGNPAILPSEKLGTLRAGEWTSDRHPDAEALAHGHFICTGCLRCTQLCPAGIPLQTFWDGATAALTRRGYTEAHGWVRCRTAGEWADVLARRGPAGEPFRPVRLSDRPETFRDCVQCTTCTSVCPVVAASDDPESDLDFTPQQVMNLLRLQLTDLALGARMVWDCATCYQCQEQCPQGVRVTDVLYELRNLAEARLPRPTDAARRGGKDGP